MIDDERFYMPTEIVYPPFKKGKYMEEYFTDKFLSESPKTKRKFIPAYWTNFQITRPFLRDPEYKKSMQVSLDKWVSENKCEHGYFIVTQHDDGCLLKLPENTLRFGGSHGDVILPLIYEDIDRKLDKVPKKEFDDKKWVCSFVGTKVANNVRPNVREEVQRKLRNIKNFRISFTNGWTNKVEQHKQDNFIDTYVDSKFGLAPRGWGRTSFRLYEIFKLGTVPVYVYNDKCWLPYQDEIDWSKFAIVIHVSKLSQLEGMLNRITASEYKSMIDEYNRIKHLFELDGMYDYIIKYLN